MNQGLFVAVVIVALCLASVGFAVLTPYINKEAQTGLTVLQTTTDTIPYSPDAQVVQVISTTGNGIDSNKVKVSTTDTTADYLISKLVAGTDITLTQNNIGGTETISIISNAATTQDSNRVAVSPTDTNASYLLSKLLAGGNMAIALVGSGATEQMRFTCADLNVYSKTSDINGTYQLKADMNTQYVSQIDGNAWYSGLPNDMNQQYYSQTDANAVFAKVSDVNAAVALRAKTSDINGTYAKISDVNGADALRAKTSDINGTYQLKADMNTQYVRQTDGNAWYGNVGVWKLAGETELVDANAITLTISGLIADTDKEYMVTYRLITALSLPNASLWGYFNNLHDYTYSTTRLLQEGTNVSGTSNTDVTIFNISNNTGVGINTIGGTFFVHADASGVTTFEGHGVCTNPASAPVGQLMFAGKCETVPCAITSITLKISDEPGFGSGSRMAVFKKAT